MGEAFISRRGGGGAGAALNFYVVGGTTPPANPAENTIWINTDVAITSWIFAAEEPSPVEAGTVWISVGASSTVAFNALRKHTLQVCPLSVKQYVGGQWVDRVAMSFQGGKWVAWIADIIVYDGGAKDIALKYQNASDKGTYINLTLATNSNSASKAATIKSDPIDLTGLAVYQVTYGSMSGEGTFAGRIKAMVWSEDGGTMVKESTVSQSKSGTITVDVSELSGKHVVGVYAYNTSGSGAGSGRVTKLAALMEESATAAEAAEYAALIAELSEVYEDA